MENIHTLDSEIVDSLINMFNSEDENNVRIGLTILNNADFTDGKVIEFVNKLNIECTGLLFALFQNKKGNIRARFAYIRRPEENRRMVMIDDQSTLDSNEWVPYEPHNDLNK